jgi:hypothetical protein
LKNIDSFKETDRTNSFDMFKLFVLTCFDFLHQHFGCYFLFKYKDDIFVHVLNYVYYRCTHFPIFSLLVCIVGRCRVIVEISILFNSQVNDQILQKVRL